MRMFISRYMADESLFVNWVTAPTSIWYWILNMSYCGLCMGFSGWSPTDTIEFRYTRYPDLVRSVIDTTPCTDIGWGPFSCKD